MARSLRRTDASGKSTGRRNRFSRAGLAVVAAVVAVGVVGFVPAMSWIAYRRTHSITDDVFVEAHIVNVAPQFVSGRLLRFLVDENDLVEKGQVVAELDPIPYRDKVNIALAQLKSAEADLARQRADVETACANPDPDRDRPTDRGGGRGRPRQGGRLTEAHPRRGRKGHRRGQSRSQGVAGLSESWPNWSIQDLHVLSSRGQHLQKRQQSTESRDSALAQVELSQARLAKASPP